MTKPELKRSESQDSLAGPEPTLNLNVLRKIPGDPPTESLMVEAMSDAWPAGERERFTVLLRIASEISGRISAILDPDDLLNAVIPMLKEEFGLYYVHVYTLDLASRELRLRAGYGESGQQMLARGHKIALDTEQSLVARAARTRQPVVVNDVVQRSDFLPNPLLPDTRSELALPMVVSGEVLGVFDIQHNEVGIFTPMYLDVFTTLVGQIATALQNARFVERIEATLAETRVRFEVGQALAEAQTEEDVVDAIMTQAGKVGSVLVLLASFDPPLARDGDAATDQTACVVVQRQDAFQSGLSLLNAPHVRVGARVRLTDFPFLSLVPDDMLFIAGEVGADWELPPDVRELMAAAGAQSLLVAPLTFRNTRLGLLIVMASLPGFLDEVCQVRFGTLAEQGAMALHQARLRDQLSLAQFSIDRAPAAILWVRPDGTIHSVNDTACELLGYTRDELLSLPSFSRLDPNMIPDVWATHWKKVKEDRRFLIETEYRTRSGKLIPMEITANYLQYGDHEFNYVFARDITERKQAETMRERFTIQLRTAAEIAEQVGAILDPDILLEAVIPLLKERFDLYHAHVYVLEDDELVLRAGYGRIGKIMVQQGHKIALHHPGSLVARAARSQEPVVVNDIAAARDFLPNLLLPRTRSEVAVPIVIGNPQENKGDYDQGRVLGVFDVQSDKAGYFTQADVDVFRTLAGQLANALYSANLFEQQRTTQRELRVAAETVRAVFNAMTEGVMVVNMMGRIVDLNAAALRLYGYETREALLGRNAVDLVTKNGWPRMAEAMRQALETGRVEVQEYTMVRQDGSTFDAEQSFALLGGDGEVPQGVVTITRDISESKQARREIARFQALAENAVDAIVMADLFGNIRYANPAAYRLFGYAEEVQGMLGSPIAELWRESDLQTLLEQALPQAGERGWQGEVMQRRKDGSHFDAALTFFTVRGTSGEPISVATIVRDITDRKAAEVELARFALQLRTAAEVTAQINAVLDPTALLELVVPLVQERFDLYHLHVYTLDEAARQLVMRVGSGEAGRIMRDQGHRIALDRTPSLVAQAARTRQIVLVDDVTESSAFMSNPLLPDTRTEVAIPMIAGDEVVGVFDVQDDTPGRFSESEIDVYSTLAAQVAIALRNARYFEEMQSAADRLREVDRLKSEFLGNMSHELRTPLNSILGYAEVMQMGLDGELTAEMKEDVAAIYENGQQLLQLISDILDLTKIEAGRMTLSKEPVAVLPLLEETRNHNLGLLHNKPKPVEIMVSATEGLPDIAADPVRVVQILNNLVSNAVKFTEQGHVHLHAFHRPEAGHVCIDVEDTGVGIARADLGKLFERFRQVDGSSTRRAEGTGLGLAITKHLVDLHDGTLSVESELGVGSTFTVCLPTFQVEGHQANADSVADTQASDRS